MAKVEITQELIDKVVHLRAQRMPLKKIADRIGHSWQIVRKVMDTQMLPSYLPREKQALTDAEHKGILTKRAAGMSYAQIANDYPVSREAIRQICGGKEDITKPRGEQMDAKPRRCLGSDCGRMFKSSGPSHRFCASCRKGYSEGARYVY